MKLSYSILAILAAAVSALPSELTNFFLVTADEATSASNSSMLAGVSATSLFDPFYRDTPVLRLQSEGYNSLPNFTLSSGTLHTWTYGPHGQGYFQYNSTHVSANSTLRFLPDDQGEGNLGLENGYLVTVDGKCEGWSICPGELGSKVLVWKAVGEGCIKTYLQAVSSPPY
ncbi:hypothetical protein CC78DRAFT_534782 [Lojkania enalia]|uniref:Cell wall protein PhiA n=1 Tax=Lojkania enalia TaxID=147567 RepID=A0A9P4K3V1_9PLEO|nr:hypothetical protein CC78DRAFT_534782 [Didymosphaeria enalia]